LSIFLHYNFLGVLSALKNLQDRLKQVECEKKQTELHLSQLTATAAFSAQSAGNISSAFYLISLSVSVDREYCNWVFSKTCVALCCVVCDSCAQWYTHTCEQFLHVCML